MKIQIYGFFANKGLIGHVIIKICKENINMHTVDIPVNQMSHICLVLTWRNGTILKISIPKCLKWVKSQNLGVFGGQNQIKVDSSPELY